MQHACEVELVVGLKAKERLADLLRSGSVDMDRDGQDRYRRTLARLSVGAGDAVPILVDAGRGSRGHARL
jgi:micrococcal nuclease